MMRVADFVENCLAYEQYAFSWDELKVKIPKTDVALRHELGRLSKKKEILALRQGFYLILPPRYKGFGKLPLEFYVEELFKFLDKPYYIAFFSAAAFHGASHQQVQQSYLMTKIPNLRDIKKGNIYLSISATSKWPNKNIQQRKSDAGIFNISSPALTAIDLIHYQSKMGGLNRILAILEELAESMTTEDIQELLQWYPHTSSIQRLGFLLEELIEGNTLTLPLKDYLKNQNYFPVLLSPEKNRKPGGANNTWKVDANIELESDL
ncbi:type IV toxin-antitoxin system AbiEi family antitoxin [Belliella marina]|uniref:Type IV toxin-antitoxin system AbiEi family antitoxin n=1 Tax=Belliella marina TaxID=1644146 RepID=A0ABW4VUV1_9BACT